MMSAEKSYRNEACLVLADWFNIQYEALMVNPDTGRKGRIDMLLNPKECNPLRAFLSTPVGVEVKHFEAYDSQKLTKTFKQAIGYSEMVLPKIGEKLDLICLLLVGPMRGADREKQVRISNYFDFVAGYRIGHLVVDPLSWEWKMIVGDHLRIAGSKHGVVENIFRNFIKK